MPVGGGSRLSIRGAIPCSYDWLSQPVPPSHSCRPARSTYDSPFEGGCGHFRTLLWDGNPRRRVAGFTETDQFETQAGRRDRFLKHQASRIDS